MRLASNVSTTTSQARAVQGSIREQFKKNMHETDKKAIEEQRNVAMRAISNYYIFYIQSLQSKNAGKKAE